MYGRRRRLKDTPDARMAMISELLAILVVKRMTATNTNSALKRLAK
ncbi:Uncharacterised protein [Segatella copri]|nr:Uncharacterised protein [Segatella copri]